MLIPPNVIANADDFGFNHSINTAILNCFEQGYINSASLIVNMGHFDEATNMIHQNNCIRNIGVHVNLAEGKPVTNFNQPEYLDENGNWDFKKVNKKVSFLSAGAKQAFLKEIDGQVNKAVSDGITITHIDSHCHLHTLPSFYKLFLAIAQQHKIKIRLAQTYSEGSFINFYYRKYLNNIFRKNNVNYSDFFEDSRHFFTNSAHARNGQTVEIMLHPHYNAEKQLSDHFDADGFQDWISFLSGK